MQQVFGYKCNLRGWLCEECGDDLVLWGKCVLWTGWSGGEIGWSGRGGDVCFSFFWRGELESLADALISARKADSHSGE